MLFLQIYKFLPKNTVTNEIFLKRKWEHYAVNHFFTTFSNLFSQNQKSTQKRHVEFWKSQKRIEKLEKCYMPTIIKSNEGFYPLKTLPSYVGGSLHALHDFFGILKNENHQAQFTYMKSMSLKTEIQKVISSWPVFGG